MSDESDKPAYSEPKQKPSVGRIVLFRKEPSNGATEHPAIITRVWSDICVNVTVFLDYGAPFNATSVNHEEDVNSATNPAWRWPPRV